MFLNLMKGLNEIFIAIAFHIEFHDVVWVITIDERIRTFLYELINFNSVGEYYIFHMNNITHNTSK